MFSIEQIYQAHKKVKSGADFPQYVQDLKDLGISHYDNFVTDGSTKYYGVDGFTLEAEAKYSQLEIHKTNSASSLKQALTEHQKGQSDYLTFCKQAAEAGVEKWTTNMLEMTVSYLDANGQLVLEEAIPSI
ncbi:MAG: DUF1398 family protein [Chitinophagales bacterium]